MNSEKVNLKKKTLKSYIEYCLNALSSVKVSHC